ncbi:MAG: histidine triad nucleotide-binding protein [Actinomycetota bacterium]|nr:histidine triad nucleotide-binding protein [Actinomycetota bacterium]
MPTGGCLFCKIITGTVPATLVREDDRTLAFRDISPQAPTHVLVIPKDHYPNVAEMTAADPGLLADVLRTAVAVADDEGITERGYRITFNTGRDAGQTVFHVHAHVLGGRGLGLPGG